MANKTLNQILTDNPATAPDGTEPVESVQGGSSVAFTTAQLALYAQRTQINNQTVTSYTVQQTDAGKVVRNANVNAITNTIPPNATVALEIGTVIAFRQVQSGQVSLQPGAGVTLNTPEGYNAKTARVGAVIMAHKVAIDEWDLTGDLESLV